MLTDPQLRSKVESLWDKLWTGGLSNPMDAIEQLSYLLFLKQLDEREQDAERAGRMRGKKCEPLFPDPKLRWSYWSQLPADKALRQVKEAVFPFLKDLGDKAGSFGAQMDQRGVQDQQAEPLDRGLPRNRRHGHFRPEPGRARRHLRISAGQAQHGRHQWPVPHPAPRHPHDGQDDRPAARRAGLRSGRRHLRLPGQRLAAPPGNPHRPSRPQLSTRKAGPTAWPAAAWSARSGTSPRPGPSPATTTTRA